MAAEGADWLDIGGESTRPGAADVSQDEEMDRVVPLVLALRATVAVPISVDTMKPAVARAAVAAGATMWNDVSALTGAPDSLSTAANLGRHVVLMHMRGRPGSMQDDPRYDDVVTEVTDYLIHRADAALAAGIAREAIWLDPGIGFGKSTAHNLALLAALERFVALGFPVLLGASRKGFVNAVDPTARDPHDRLGGSLAAALAAARAGVAMVRVHDVRETVQALAVASAIAVAGRDD
jgi:dihydropteroate synthase